MSNTVEMINGLKKEYNEELYRIVDQKLSYLKPIVDIKQVTKEGLFLDNVGQTSFVKDNSAFVTVESKQKDVAYGRRELKTSKFYDAHPVDRSISELLSVSSSSYISSILEEMAKAYAYLCDKVIYESFDADAIDKDGNAITFANDGGITGSDLKAIADFTASKFVEQKQRLLSKGFGLYENNAINFICTDVERSLLENNANVSNTDYMKGFGVMQDNDGNLKRLKGVELVTLASVGTSEHPSILYKSGNVLGSNYRKCFMFNSKAVTLGITKDIISEIVDAKETYFDTSLIKANCKIGATRNANSGIVLIKTPVSMS